MAFVLERCERGRGIKPRWAAHGIEFLIIASGPGYTRHLVDDEFASYKVNTKLSAKLVVLILTFCPTIQRFCFTCLKWGSSNKFRECNLFAASRIIRFLLLLFANPAVHYSWLKLVVALLTSVKLIALLLQTLSYSSAKCFFCHLYPSFHLCLWVLLIYPMPLSAISDNIWPWRSFKQQQTSYKSQWLFRMNALVKQQKLKIHWHQKFSSGIFLLFSILLLRPRSSVATTTLSARLPLRPLPGRLRGGQRGRRQTETEHRDRQTHPRQGGRSGNSQGKIKAFEQARRATQN